METQMVISHQLFQAEVWLLCVIPSHHSQKWSKCMTTMFCSCFTLFTLLHSSSSLRRKLNSWALSAWLAQTKEVSEILDFMICLHDSSNFCFWYVMMKVCSFQYWCDHYISDPAYNTHVLYWGLWDHWPLWDCAVILCVLSDLIYNCCRNLAL